MAIKAQVYSDGQRYAIAETIVDKHTTAREAVRRAEAGELTFEGEPLEPFTMPIDSARHYARTLRKRRRGLGSSRAAAMPPKDAIEALRRRLVSAAEHEIERIEAAQRAKDGKSAAERIAGMVKVLRELDALNRPAEPRTRQVRAEKGEKAPTAGASGQVSGLARDLLQDHRGAQRQPATMPPMVERQEQEPETAPEPELGSEAWIMAQRAKQHAA